MNYVIECENIKCGGCANTIETKIRSIDGVESVAVAIENGVVDVDGDEGIRELVVETLLASGYPEKGSVEGIKAATAKARRGSIGTHCFGTGPLDFDKKGQEGTLQVVFQIAKCDRLTQVFSCVRILRDE